MLEQVMLGQVKSGKVKSGRGIYSSNCTVFSSEGYRIFRLYFVRSTDIYTKRKIIVKLHSERADPTQI